MAVLDTEQARILLSSMTDQQKAELLLQGVDSPFEIQSLVLDLTTAQLDSKPYKISFPFKSVFVRDATDPYATVNIRPGTQDSFQSAVAVKLNDSMVFKHPITSAFLDWTAQSGKTITLIFFVSAEFKSGSQISVTGGSVAVGEGSSVSTTVKTLVAATPLLVCDQNSLRKVSSFENETGADMWVGPSTVSNAGGTKGKRLLPGAIFEWRNSAALYGYSVAGGSIVVMDEV